MSTKLKKVWDNTNIAESYPGITLPLTFSFIKNAYANVYENFLIAVGVNKTRVSAASNIYSNLLGHIHGHVYYNALNWYKMIELLPGYKYNKDFLEAMWNPAKKHIDTITKKNTIWSIIKVLPALAYFLLKIISVKGKIKKFTIFFRNKYRFFFEENINHLSLSDLKNRYFKLEKTFFAVWSVPIINDFRVMIFHGILKKISVKIFEGNSEEIISRILSHHIELLSVEPMIELYKLAEQLKKNRIELTQNNKKEIWQMVQSNNKYSDLKKNIKNYINTFGYRNPSELKLESPTMVDSPEMIMDLLFLYTKNLENNQSIKRIGNNLVDLNKLKKEFIDKQGFIGLMTWPLIKWLIKVAKEAIAAREEIRLLRSLAFGLVRTNFKQMAKILKSKNLITNEDDIFYLNMEELFKISNYTELQIKKIISERKIIFNTYENENNPPRRLITTGEDLNHFVSDIVENNISTNQTFYGIGVSAGKVRGKVICMKHFDATIDVNDKILVTEQTDPGWTLIFPMIKGIITERGNMLSHAAIVSREFGIPGVLGVDNIMNILKNDMEIEVDGSEGKIKIIK